MPDSLAGRCPVCSAPLVDLNGACVFCRSPLEVGERGEPDVPALLEYLAERLPGATVKRSGLFGRGPIKELVMQGRPSRFRALLRGPELRLEPAVALSGWLDLLLGELSRIAAVDPEIRRGYAGSGWAFRRQA